MVSYFTVQQTVQKNGLLVELALIFHFVAQPLIHYLVKILILLAPSLHPVLDYFYGIFK